MCFEGVGTAMFASRSEAVGLLVWLRERCSEVGMFVSRGFRPWRWDSVRREVQLPLAFLSKIRISTWDGPCGL